MEHLLNRIRTSFVVVSAIELGIGPHTQYLNNCVLSLTSLCRNSEKFHKYRFDDIYWRVQHFAQPLDIVTFFDYYNPEYDLGVISSNRFDECLAFFDRLTLNKTPYIVSQSDFGFKRGYTQALAGDSFNKIYFYYRDRVRDWE